MDVNVRLDRSSVKLENTFIGLSTQRYQGKEVGREGEGVSERGREGGREGVSERGRERGREGGREGEGVSERGRERGREGGREGRSE